MIFTWSGKGYWVPLAAASTTLSLMALTYVLGIDVQDEVITAIAASTTGVFIWKLHFWVRDNASLVTLHVDDDTGVTEKLRVRHDFCGLPLWFWGLLFGSYGLYTTLRLTRPELLAAANQWALRALGIE